MAATKTVQIEMPAMGESVSEGTVLEWHKGEGDFVEEGETIVEVSTDKVDAEVPATASGTMTKLLVEVDDVVKVGQALAEIEPGDGDGSSNGSAPAAESTDEERGGRRRAACPTPAGAARATRTSARTPSPKQLQEEEQADAPTQEPGGSDASSDAGSGETIDLTMPEMGESVTEGTVLEWHKQPGDTVEEGDTIIEVSTDKVDAEVPSPATGTLTETAGRARRRRQGRPGARRGSRSAPAAARAPATASAPSDGAGSGERGAGEVDSDAKASPVAKRIAAAEGIDLGKVEGTGSGGKVMKADVLAAADGGANGARPATAAEGRRRGQAAPRAGRDARQGDGREPLDPDRDLLPHASRRHARGQAQGAQRRARRARDEGLLHPPDRLGDRRGAAASGPRWRAPSRSGTASRT